MVERTLEALTGTESTLHAWAMYDPCTAGWNPPVQALYTRVTEYLELESRVELLNSRFAVLQVGVGRVY